MVEKGEQVCSQYWPELNETEEYHDIIVKQTEVTEFACYLVRVFEIKKGEKGKGRWVKQFHYTDWPGHRDSPFHPLPFLDFVKRVNSWTPQSEEPMAVHCISGTGRTGVFIVVNNQMKRVDRKGDISIFFNVEEVCDERFQAVKSLPEYIFIHDCVLEYFSYRDMSEIPLNAIIDTVKERSVETMGVSKFQLDFEKLSRANAKTENKSEAGNLPANRAKNRFDTVLPFDGTRVVLKKSKSNTDNYINASFIDSYRSKAFFIATQAPIEDTIFDFWRMVWEQDVRSIAVLLEKDMFPPNEVYWPETGMVLEAANFQIKVLSYEEIDAFDLRQVTITNKKMNETRHLRIFHIKKWPNDRETENDNLRDIISMIQQSKLWTEKAKGKKILVHCSSGCGRTGVFIALNNAMEQAEFDKNVDVFNIVRRLRQQRIVMIQNKHQYELVHRGVAVYYRHFYRTGAHDGPLIENGVTPTAVTGEASSGEDNTEEEAGTVVSDKISLISTPSNKSAGEHCLTIRNDSLPPNGSAPAISEDHEMADVNKDIVVDVVS